MHGASQKNSKLSYVPTFYFYNVAGSNFPRKQKPNMVSCGVKYWSYFFLYSHKLNIMLEVKKQLNE